jgi:hypothetical protein
MRTGNLLLIAILATGCASQSYRNTPPGKFIGELDVRWVENDYFVFLPNKDKPFKFIRTDGSTIQPGTMYTDGGSIPRFLWGIKGYSPWGYAPAYIIHDWLFEAKHCGYEPDSKYSFKDSIDVMAEGMKAVMERNPEVRDSFVFDSVVAAVASPISERLWIRGSCQAPTQENYWFFGLNKSEPGELLMTIKFE